jgi:hypothetical protein
MLMLRVWQQCAAMAKILAIAGTVALVLALATSARADSIINLIGATGEVMANAITLDPNYYSDYEGPVKEENLTSGQILSICAKTTPYDALMPDGSSDANAWISYTNSIDHTTITITGSAAANQDSTTSGSESYAKFSSVAHIDTPTRIHAVGYFATGLLSESSFTVNGEEFMPTGGGAFDKTIDVYSTGDFDFCDANFSTGEVGVNGSISGSWYIQVTMETIPEPSGLLMFGTAILGIAGRLLIHKRRKNTLS